MSRVEFLGLDFDRPTMSEVEHWLRHRDADSAYAYVVTPNVDHMVRIGAADEAVRRAYADADLTLCDSRVLARLARLSGVSLSVVPGSDLSQRLFASVLERGDRICLIGGRESDAAALEKLYPGITVIQHRPPMGLRENPRARAQAVDMAVATGARVTFFAVGSPQQELLAHEMAMRPGARGTGMCIGASVDFLAGAQTRAPIGFQRLGIEWAWRLLSDPRRLGRRYLVEGPAIFPMVWRWRRGRRQ